MYKTDHPLNLPNSQTDDFIFGSRERNLSYGSCITKKLLYLPCIAGFSLSGISCISKTNEAIFEKSNLTIKNNKTKIIC